jgi:hypothetical protein
MLGLDDRSILSARASLAGGDRGPMATRWLNIEVERAPQAVRSFLEALEHARLRGHPKAGASIGAVGNTSNEWSEPDVARRYYRNVEHRFLNKLSRLADDFESAIRREPRVLSKKNRCRNCGRGGRPQAAFCDGCGSSDLESDR